MAHPSPSKPLSGRILEIVSVAGLISMAAHAQELPLCSSLPCSTVHTVAASDQAVPLEYTFTIGTPGNYQLTLTDLGAQAPFDAPLAYVKLAITSGASIVGTPLAAAGTTHFSATAGTYVIHVTGKPGTGLGSGPIGIEVQSTGGGAPVAEFSGALALPASTLPSNESVLSDSFTVQTAGTYQVALTDLQFPQALSIALAVIIVPGASSPVAVLGAGEPTTATVSLQATTYDVFAVGQAGSNSGLFSVTVAPAASTTPIYSKVQTVGTATLIDNVPLHADSYTLKLTDLRYPSALSQLGALVTLDGQAVQPPLTAGGSQQFTAAAGTYQVFAAGSAGSSGGSYGVDLLSSSGASLLDEARAVSGSTGSVLGYSFDATLQTGGTYSLDLADFDVPLSFTTLQAVAVQGGALLGTRLGGAGTVSISPAAGPLSILVFATPDASSSPAAGLFGVDIAASANASPLFQATQAVGQLFASQQVSISQAGDYLVAASDVDFPEPLGSLAVIVTQGANLLGKIFVAGTLKFSATPGNYVVSVLPEPQAAQQGDPDEAGTYAATVSATPSPPTATLISNVTSVQSGGAVLLQWSSTAATSCTASSSPRAGFSGTVATSGEQMSSELTQSTTFTLTCAGAGGSSSPQSLTVSITKRGGGGLMSPALLALLASLALARARTRRAYLRRR
ncbi:MAG TPA: hypothetical protein VMU40_06650 [Steroidobacteraceae bacterium]|nr:hypothetical protein [Steroidobacteraceae bacterium]